MKPNMFPSRVGTRSIRAPTETGLIYSQFGFGMIGPDSVPKK